MWIRLCDQCKADLAVDGRRFIKLKKASVLYYKDGRFHCESKNNDSEISICENCARDTKVRDLFVSIKLLADGAKIKDGPHSEEGE